jgi:hypothetical protein
MRNHFSPKGGRYGTMPEIVTGRQLDAGLTANTTTRITVSSAIRKAIIARITAYAATLVVDSDGTVLATVKKFNQATNTTTSLTAAFDLEVANMTALKPANIPLLTTLTDSQLTVAEGEIIVVDIVNNSAAIDTQPKELTFSAELLIQE